MEVSNDAQVGLNEELRSKVVACGSADELRGLAEACGADLEDEMLVGVAGGDEDDDVMDADDLSGDEEARVTGVPRCILKYQK